MWPFTSKTTGDVAVPTSAVVSPGRRAGPATLGRELLAGRNAARGAQGTWRRAASEWLLDWATRDPEFKVQLFRFVDLLPTLRTADQVQALLSDYLSQPGVTLPPGMSWGLKAGRLAPQALAKGITQSITGMATSFIGGESIAEVLPLLRERWSTGTAFSVDLLGEACLSDREAEQYQRAYGDLIETLAREVACWPAMPVLETSHLGPLPRAHVSIKISALSARMKPEDDAGTLDRLEQQLEPLLAAAAQQQVFVNFDMEQHAWKDLTIRLFERCCERHAFPAGIALQAYLRSAPDDVARLIRWSQRTGRQVTVRWIKGAYWDYEVIEAERLGWPCPVWQHKGDTDACFEAMIEQLVAATPRTTGAGGIHLALGSHNVRSIAVAQAALQAADLPPSAAEYQLLLGMAEDLSEALRVRGQRVRTYVPIGALLPGMAYLVRRLLENTSNESWLRSSTSEQLGPEQLLAPPRTHEFPRPAQAASVPAVHAAGRHDKSLAASPFVNEPLRDFAAASQREAFRQALQRYRPPEMPPELAPQELEPLVQRAVRATDDWQDLPLAERAGMLIRTADALRRQRDDWSALLIDEAGKTWREADAEVCEAIDFCEFYARQALDQLVERPLSRLVGEQNHWQRRGVGPTAVIGPWNFPLAIPLGMTVAALVAGNPVLVKPAEQTPRVARRFCEELWRQGVPGEVLQWAAGPGETIGAALVDHPQIPLIAFTGSRQVGLQILSRAGAVPSGQAMIKRVVCEMGGKNGIIVDTTADLDEAVAGVCRSAFGYAGQKCSACSRVIVVRDHLEVFLERLVAMTESLQIGDPRDPATDVGPVIDAEAAARIHDRIADARMAHRLVLGKEVPPALAAAVGKPFVGPHIFTDVAPDAPLAQEEIFGPVLAVLVADSFTHALAIANQTDYKLTGAVYSRTPAHLAQARRHFRVGNLYLNRGCTGALVGRQPFGGFGQSGTGTKAGGSEYLRHFVYDTIVCENTLRRGFAPEISTQTPA